MLKDEYLRIILSFSAIILATQTRSFCSAYSVEISSL